MSAGVSFGAEVIRFGGHLLVPGQTLTLEAKIRDGARHGGYKASDTLEHFTIAFSHRLADAGKNLTHFPCALEFWTAYINGDRQDEEYPWIYWQYPLVKWELRDRLLFGRTMEGPELNTPWMQLDPQRGRDEGGRGAWMKTDRPPPDL